MVDFKEKCLASLYQNRLDGLITCNALVQNYGFLKICFLEIGYVFPRALYKPVNIFLNAGCARVLAHPRGLFLSQHPGFVVQIRQLLMDCRYLQSFKI